jgi:hypothetical protein
MSGAPGVLLLRSTLKVWPLLAVHATTTTSVAEALLLRPGIPNTETSTKSEMHNMTKRFVFIFKLLSELAIHRSRDWINQFGDFSAEDSTARRTQSMSARAVHDGNRQVSTLVLFKIDDALFRHALWGWKVLFYSLKSPSA